MARTEPNEEDLKTRLDLAKQFQKFRDTFGFTQKTLAETLKSIDTRKSGKRIGVSRRTIQQIENGAVTPHDHTIKLFEELKRRYEKNKAA